MPNFIFLGSLEVAQNYDTPCCIWPHFFMLKFNIIISKNGMLAKTWWQNIVFWTNAVYFVSQQIFRAECGYCFKYWTNFLDFYQFFCIRVLNLSMKNLSIATTYLVSFHNWFLGGKGGGLWKTSPPLYHHNHRIWSPSHVGLNKRFLCFIIRIHIGPACGHSLKFKTLIRNTRKSRP